MKRCTQPLMPMPVHLALAVDEESYLREMRRLKIRDYEDFVAKDANGVVHYFENDENGMTYIVVCLDRKKLAELEPIKQACLIVHEAVHVYQECLQYLGEKRPGREFEAYSIQHISEQLMRAYVELTA